jgi:hypothetical protein
MSGALTPVYHRFYHEADQRPNFYLDPVARDLARFGRPAAPEPLRLPAPRVPARRTVVLRPCVPHTGGPFGIDGRAVGSHPVVANGRARSAQLAGGAGPEGRAELAGGAGPEGRAEPAGGACPQGYGAA